MGVAALAATSQASLDAGGMGVGKVTLWGSIQCSLTLGADGGLCWPGFGSRI